MRLLSFLSLLFMAIGLSSCSGVITGKNTRKYEELDPGLAREVQALSKHNWIVIADQSFPLHTRRGVRTLLVDKEIPEVLNGVIGVLESQKQVSPIFYRTRELDFVENDSAPGIDFYRSAITDDLRDYDVRKFLYNYLSVVLEDDSKTFAVLVIKTKTALPYSAIFIELDGGN